MGCFVRRFAVLLVGCAVAAGASPAAFAAVPPTTPTPVPRPGDPPVAPPPPQSVPRPVVASAGTAIGMLRLLPRTMPTDSILDDPEFEDKLPRHALAEVGLGVASARANSEAYLGTERVIAEASPAGFSLDGKIPRLPGSLVQTSLPDRPNAETGGLRPPASPLVDFGVLDGRVRTRWDREVGPCAARSIADSEVSLAGATATWPDGRPLLRTPDALHARSTIDLADIPGQGDGVRATSRMRLTSIQLFTGSETTIDVLSRPVLTAISTGDPATSRVDHRAPVLRVTRNGQELGVLDAAHPALEVPTDFGLVELRIGQPTEERTGARVRARADLLRVRVLPADRLGSPAALAELSFGEQRVTAEAPEGGVDCSPAPVAAPPPPGPGAPTAVPPGEPPIEIPLLLASTGTALLFLLFRTALRRGVGAHSP